MTRRSFPLRRLVTVTSGAWGVEPEDGEMQARCVRGTDFDYCRLRADVQRAPLRGFKFSEFVARRLRPGDLIIEKSGGGEQQPVGRVVLFETDAPAVPTNFAARLRPGASLDSRFAKYLFASLYSTGIIPAAIKQTTGIQNLDLDGVLSTRVDIPHHSGQRAIADYLDAETARTDALIAKRRRIVELLDERWTSVSSDLATGYRDPESLVLIATEPRVPSHVDWIDTAPASWGRYPLKCFFRFSKGKDAQRLTQEYIAEHPGEYPVYSGQTAADGHFGLIDSYDFDCRAGAILVSTVGAQAMTCRFVTGQFSLSQNCALMLPVRGSKIDLTFILAQLNYLFRIKRAGIPDHMQPSLRIEDLSGYWVVVPPVERQIEIAAALRRIEALTSVLKTKSSSLVEVLRERRQALITVAVTGALDASEVKA